MWRSWERGWFGSIDGVRTVQKRKPPKTLQPCVFRAVWKTKNSGQKCVWPQIWPLTRPQFNNYRGVAQLVARDIWDVDAAGSNPVTPTKNQPKMRFSAPLSAVFCLQFDFAATSANFQCLKTQVLLHLLKPTSGNMFSTQPTVSNLPFCVVDLFWRCDII